MVRSALPATAVCLAAFHPSVSAAQVTAGPASLDLARLDAQTVPIVFSVTRDASDRPAAGSAVWVFAKFQAPAGDWRDVRWAEDGHSARAGSTASAVSVTPATGGPFIPGVFLQGSDSKAPGTWEAELRWDFSSSQIEMPEDGLAVRVVTVDMVRVPEGPFQVGDGEASDEVSTFYGPDGGPFRISGEEAAGGLDDLSTPGNRVYAGYDATYGGENEGFPGGADGTGGFAMTEGAGGC